MFPGVLEALLIPTKSVNFRNKCALGKTKQRTTYVDWRYSSINWGLTRSTKRKKFRLIKNLFTLFLNFPLAEHLISSLSKWYISIISMLFLNYFHKLFSVEGFLFSRNFTAQKMKISIKNFFSKCGHICRKLWIWTHLLDKSLLENFLFCAELKRGFLWIFHYKKENYFKDLFSFWQFHWKFGSMV